MHTDDIERDRQSYKKLVEELGLPEDVIRAQVTNENDCCDFPPEFKGRTYRDKSAIDGIGLFAKKEYKNGELIGPARLAGLRTDLGRYSNHSADPNAMMQMVGNDLYVVACREIKENEEITTNYSDTILTQFRGNVP
jgi:SET domain-containing protein